MEPWHMEPRTPSSGVAREARNQLDFGGNFFLQIFLRRFFRCVVRVHIPVEKFNELSDNAVALERGE